jgi:hypothetical protein
MKGKKLILVSFPDSPYARFADETHSSLRTLTTSSKQLFLYNQNRISEKQAGSIWELVGSTNRILVTTDYRNHGGFLAIHPTSVKTPAVDFAISFGSTVASNAAFKVAVCEYLSESQADVVVLPAPSYLDIDGVAIGDNGMISRFCNPTKSGIICELLRLFYQLQWIHPNTADIPFWNAEAESFLGKLESFKPNMFDALPLDKSLREEVEASDAPAESLMASLYSLRTKAVKF